MSEPMLPVWVMEQIKSRATDLQKQWEREEQAQTESNMQDHARGVQYGVNFLLIYINSALEVYGKKEASAIEAEGQTKSSTDSLTLTCNHCNAPCETVSEAFNGCSISICESCFQSIEFQHCDKCMVLTHVSDLSQQDNGDITCDSCIEKQESSRDWEIERQISEYREGWGA